MSFGARESDVKTREMVNKKGLLEASLRVEARRTATKIYETSLQISKDCEARTKGQKDQ